MVNGQPRKTIISVPLFSMSTLTLTPKLQISQPPTERIERKTILGSLAIKFATWLEKTPAHIILRVWIQFSAVALVAAFIFIPTTAFTATKEIVTWNNYRVPLFVLAIVFLFNLKRIYRATRLLFVRPSKAIGNQHTLVGVAVPELADFLIEHNGFGFDTVMAKLGMAQRQYAKLADLLEENAILIRGEKNARVLNEISRTILVENLRALAQGKATPFVWSKDRTLWYERNGSMETWAINHDFKQRKMKEEVERKERKLERLNKRIGQSVVLADLFSKTA